MAEIVTDPKGVVSRGKTHPAGTPVETIRPNDAELAAWRRFKQVGDSEAKPESESAPAKRAK